MTAFVPSEMRMLRRYLDNPVFLRDLGWAYYPPVLGRYNRRRVQFGVAGLMLAVVLAMVVVAEIKIPDRGAGALVLVAFAITGGAVLIIRSAISGIYAWRKERDLKTIDELILTGMKPEEFAAAKVFARGFVFVAGSIVLALMAFAGVTWMFFSGSFGAISGSDVYPAILVFTGLTAAMPAMVINYYLRMLRAALRRGIGNAARVAASTFCWFVLLPVVTILYIGITGMIVSQSTDKAEYIPGYVIWMLVPGFYLLLVTAYRLLVRDIQEHYLKGDE